MSGKMLASFFFFIMQRISAWMFESRILESKYQTLNQFVIKGAFRKTSQPQNFLSENT